MEAFSIRILRGFSVTNVILICDGSLYPIPIKSRHSKSIFSFFIQTEPNTLKQNDALIFLFSALVLLE